MRLVFTAIAIAICASGLCGVGLALVGEGAVTGLPVADQVVTGLLTGLAGWVTVAASREARRLLWQEREEASSDGDGGWRGGRREKLPADAHRAAKICPQCGREFRRGFRPTEEWQRMRFCTPACAGRSHGGRKGGAK